MDVQEKRARYRDVREKALGITDKAIAEGRQLTEAEQAQIEEAVKEGKTLAAELEAGRLAAPPELMKALEEFARSPEALKLHGGDYQVDHRGRVIRPKDDGQTLGLKDAERPHPWATAIVEACKAHGVKTFGMPSGSIPLAPVSTMPISMGQLGAPLVQAIGLRAWPADTDRANTRQARWIAFPEQKPA